MLDGVTAINAKPEPIGKFLQDYLYVIPEFQRRYSWEKEQCIKLWDDLMDYAESGDSVTPYFIGNVVIYNQDSKRFVIDGQQRLITLNIFVKALLNYCATYSALEHMLYQTDSRTKKFLEPRAIRIDHRVLSGNEAKELEQVLLKSSDSPASSTNSKFKTNHSIFEDKIKKYTEGKNSKEVEEFIQRILEKVIILPIECTDLNSALTIFETINNRGMPLSDSDIFKAKLYGFAKQEGMGSDFFERWDGITEDAENLNLDLKDLFTHYMHVLRGKEKNIDKLQSLRSFFDSKGRDNEPRLANWQQVLDALEKLIWSWGYILKRDVSPMPKKDIINYTSVLIRYPNYYCEYPIMMFMYKNVKKGTKDNFKLSAKNNKALLSLLKETARYCYRNWLQNIGVNGIKVTIFKTVRDIYHKNDYLINFDADREKTNEIILKENLDSELGKAQRTDLCLLLAALNKQQKEFIPEDTTLEHILPRKWDKYKYDGGWNKKLYEKNHNKLGNLVALEKELNVRSSNDFFSEKKKKYKKSAITEAKLLKKYSKWTIADFNKRQEEKKKELQEFLLNN